MDAVEFFTAIEDRMLGVLPSGKLGLVAVPPAESDDKFSDVQPALPRDLADAFGQSAAAGMTLLSAQSVNAALRLDQESAIDSGDLESIFGIDLAISGQEQKPSPKKKARKKRSPNLKKKKATKKRTRDSTTTSQTRSTVEQKVKKSVKKKAKLPKASTASKRAKVASKQPAIDGSKKKKGKAKSRRKKAATD